MGSARCRVLPSTHSRLTAARRVCRPTPPRPQRRGAHPSAGCGSSALFWQAYCSLPGREERCSSSSVIVSASFPYSAASLALWLGIFLMASQADVSMASFGSPTLTSSKIQLKMDSSISLVSELCQELRIWWLTEDPVPDLTGLQSSWEGEHYINNSLLCNENIRHTDLTRWGEAGLLPELGCFRGSLMEESSGKEGV